jgi:hypothetical protein
LHFYKGGNCFRYYNQVLSSIPIITKETLKDREIQRDKAIVDFETFKKGVEKKREEEKSLNEDIKTDLRVDLERRRKEFNELQVEESKKREAYPQLSQYQFITL